MAATDYPPSRLESAKNAAEVLINNLEPNDHTGIILFESGATTVSYLTPFKEKTIDDLHAIRQRDGATAIGDGLVLGVDMANSIPNKKKVVILLSDGDHNAGVVTPNEAVQYAIQKKIQIHTIGMGSEEPVLLGTNIYGNPSVLLIAAKVIVSTFLQDVAKLPEFISGPDSCTVAFKSKSS